jgi:4-aminobutyrate aminotransferase-like enzyme
MTSPTTPKTIADSLAENPAVIAARQTLLHQLAEAQSVITGVRGPTAELVAGYEATLDRAAALRGRSGVYPYLGSGLGRGSLVELADGSVKYDMITGIGVYLFGHSEPDLVATALQAAMGDTVMQGNLQFNAQVVELADLLVTEAARSSRIRHCFLTNSGAIANESAIKVCMQATGGHRVLAFAHGFAGRTVLLSQVSDNPAGRVGLTAQAPVDFIPFYDANRGAASIEESVVALREAMRRHAGQVACFCMELIQGEGGFNVAPPEYFRALIDVCREHSVPVWFDEVQTFGRTNSMFYFDHLGLGEYADVVTIGKMSQACATLYTEALNPNPGLLSGTFIASTAALCVGRRVLQRLLEGGYYGPDGRIARLHESFRAEASRLVAGHPEWFEPIPDPLAKAEPSREFIGGVGGMMRLTPFGGQRPRIMEALHAMYADGVIAFVCGHGPHHIRFLAPVGVMEPQDMTEVFKIVEGSLARVASASS